MTSAYPKAAQRRSQSGYALSIAWWPPVSWRTPINARAAIAKEDRDDTRPGTMNSLVRIRNLDSGEITSYRLVFPKDADLRLRSISVLAPIGAALFGRLVGEHFHVPVSSGQTRRYEVVEIVYQPEAAGHLDM